MRDEVEVASQTDRQRRDSQGDSGSFRKKGGEMNEGLRAEQVLMRPNLHLQGTKSSLYLFTTETKKPQPACLQLFRVIHDLNVSVIRRLGFLSLCFCSHCE